MVEIEGKQYSKEYVKKAIKLYDDLLNGKLIAAIKEEIQNEL